MTLSAANKSSISTYGSTLVDLDIGLRRTFTHPFVIADVSNAIIGADFLATHNILVDLARRRLTDGTTGLETPQLSALSADTTLEGDTT